MIQIDIDVKIEKIQVQATASGMTAIFELKDANNPDTELFLTFYKKQIDYIMKRFYEVDRAKIKDEIRLEFLARERGMKAKIRQEIEMERAETKKAMTPRGVADA